MKKNVLTAIFNPSRQTQSSWGTLGKFGGKLGKKFGRFGGDYGHMSKGGESVKKHFSINKYYDTSKRFDPSKAVKRY
jgi:hypothetical protein